MPDSHGMDKKIQEILDNVKELSLAVSAHHEYEDGYRQKVTSDIEKILKILNGNGEIGLVSKIELLEQREIAHSSRIDKIDGVLSKIAWATASLLVTMITSLIGFFFIKTAP